MTKDIQVDAIWARTFPYRTIWSKPNIRNYVLCFLLFGRTKRLQACISHTTGQNHIQPCHEIPLISNVGLVWFHLLFTCYSNRSAVARQRNVYAVIWVVERWCASAHLQTILQHISTAYELTDWTAGSLLVDHSPQIWHGSAAKQSLPPYTIYEDFMCCRSNLMLPLSEWLINVTEMIKKHR
jgi:hypothetical protein